MRVYLLTVKRRGEAKKIKFGGDGSPTDTPGFIQSFIEEHEASTGNTELERTWSFEPSPNNEPGKIRGLIRYGTFGFESDFVDPVTRERHYKRKKDHVEQIPLYFEFWFPEGFNGGFAVFQSFKGRSCVDMVRTAMRVAFEAKHPEYLLRVMRLVPSPGDKGVYSQAPVRKLSLVQRKATGDVVEKYFSGRRDKPVNVELTLTAGRGGSLGLLGALKKGIPSAAGGLFLDEDASVEAVAEIRVGKRIRKIGVYGVSADAGLIDISDSIKFGPDGHPDFASLIDEADQLLIELHEPLRYADL
jgi:hypothetical protein